MAKNRTSFAPGRSGNPSGRPKAALALQELARTHTPEAMECLVKATREGNIAAAVALLDRGYGKPATVIMGDAAQPLLVDFRWANDPIPPVVPQVIEHAALDAAVEQSDEAELDEAETEWQWATTAEEE